MKINPRWRYRIKRHWFLFSLMAAIQVLAWNGNKPQAYLAGATAITFWIQFLLTEWKNQRWLDYRPDQEWLAIIESADALTDKKFNDANYWSDRLVDHLSKKERHVYIGWETRVSGGYVATLKVGETEQTMKTWVGHDDKTPAAAVRAAFREFIKARRADHAGI
jgi:hypothetical protein